MRWGRTSELIELAGAVSEFAQIISGSELEGLTEMEHKAQSPRDSVHSGSRLSSVPTEPS